LGLETDSNPKVSVVASQWRNVEVGRVVLFVSGPFASKTAAIVEIVDHKRVCAHHGGLPGGTLEPGAMEERMNRRLT
jgi:hypothetical protein